MKVLVYGSQGWIGQQFTEILSSACVDFVAGKSRLNDPDSVSREMDTHKPTHVVSFTGRTHGSIGDKQYTTIDYLEQPGKLVDNVRDNLYGPIVLAKICSEKAIHLTYLGTGCIFKFDQDHPFGKEENGFREDALPNFFGSSYSIVKGFTDQIMSLYGDQVLNLRIRMPITGQYHARNFITKITKYEKICSIPNSMTVLPELLPKVLEMMRQSVTGTLNLTNPGLISHNEILEMYRELVDPTFTYQNFSQEEQRKILAADRSNNYLDTSRLESLFPDVKDIRTSVRSMLTQYGDTLPSPIKIATSHPNSTTSVISKVDISSITHLLVTGGAGFIGSNFVNYFCTQYPEIPVTNLDALYYCANKDNIRTEIQNSPNYTFIHGNLQSFDLLRHIFQTNQISHVIHFAAQSHVQDSFTDSLRYTNDNILGTHNLLEVNRLYNSHLVKFVHVSTDEVYGESMNSVDERHKTEHSVLCPTNPYAATKASAELIAQSYNHSFKLPVVISRGNNVYGPNQYPEKLIPRFIQQLREGKPVTIQGDGSCVRAFMHVDDTSRAFEKILLNGKIGEIYNIGCNDGMEHSVMEVAKTLILEIQGTDEYSKWISFVEDRPFNDQRYYISNQKLKDLGWDVSIPFREGIRTLLNK